MKPMINKFEDGSLLIEWITKNERFYISIESNPKESSWGFIAKKRFGSPMLAKCGDLPKELIEAIKAI
jgi:hypothetical protein